MAGVIITERKISAKELKREYKGIAFDISVKNIYIQKLKTVMISRTSSLSRIDENTVITAKLMDEFINYYEEIL